MLVRKSNTTSWVRLGIVVGVSVVSLWFVLDSFSKPFVEWNKFNEIRIAEINAVTQ